jgi:predicted nucleic acid-binding protein
VFVIDASTALKWFLHDEASVDADAILKRIENGETAIAPDNFRLEIQNGLLSAERSSRISQTDVEDALDQLRNLPIRIVPSADRFIPGSELGLARHYDLSVYDAAYFACADALNVELVTSDASLAHAVRSLGIATTFVE